MPARSACCADDSSPNVAATRDACALRVTSGGRGQLAFTTRGGKGEGRKWFQERNGRRVLKIYDDHGKNRYWRAPRPHPRPNRRKRRRTKKGILQEALAQKESSSSTTTSDATEAILVLQRALREAHCREQKLVASTIVKQAKKERQLQRAKAKNELLEEQVADAEDELYSTEAELSKARQKIVKMQEQREAASKQAKHAQKKIGELRCKRDAADKATGAAEAKLQQAQRRIKKLRNSTAPQPKTVVAAAATEQAPTYTPLIYYVDIIDNRHTSYWRCQCFNVLICFVTCVLFCITLSLVWIVFMWPGYILVMTAVWILLGLPLLKKLAGAE